jgi:hypothetical protein
MGTPKAFYFTNGKDQIDRMLRNHDNENRQLETQRSHENQQDVNIDRTSAPHRTLRLVVAAIQKSPTSSAAGSRNPLE